MNFDLVMPGVPFYVRAAVTRPTATYLLVYTPLFGGAAALIDPRTGLAQVQTNFGHGMNFDGVTVLHGETFMWWQHGQGWAVRWNTALPWVPMPGITNPIDP